MNAAFSHYSGSGDKEGFDGWLSKASCVRWLQRTIPAAREFVGPTTLYTDSTGAKNLESVPFDKVVTCYDSLDSSLPWQLGIMKVGQDVLTEPYIHVDADLWLLNPLTVEFASSDVVFECYERDHIHETACLLYTSRCV